MPLPEPRANESEDEFVARCIPLVIESEDLDAEDEEDREQATAICYSQWREAREEKSVSLKAIRSSARTPQYEGTEERDWGSVKKTFANFVDGYFKFNPDAERPEDEVGSIESASQAMRSWIAAKSLLGNADGETFDELCFFPVVNPNTNRLNRGALTAVVSGRGQQAKIPEGAKGSATERAYSLLEKEFDFEREEKAVNLADLMAVKILSEDAEGAVVGGIMCIYADAETKDLQGEYFTPETQTWHDTYKSVPALFHHGLDDTIGLAHVGKRVKAEARDEGLWVEDWLNKGSEYWKLVKPLLEAKALYYSPGSAPHLVRKDEDGRLLSYPVIEDTLTVTPAQHRLRPIERIKAAYKSAGLDLPDDLLDSDSDRGDAGGASRSEMERARQKALTEIEEALIDIEMEV